VKKKPTKISFPEPPTITGAQARDAVDEVWRKMPDLPLTAARREAARMLGVDYATFNAALTGTGTQTFTASHA
jgi:hypothetical protein